jgi:hypothetical protein
MPIPNQRGRLGGSAHTVFHWGDGTGPDHVIGFAEAVRVDAVRPVAPPGILHPINALRPVEIVVPDAHGPGTITLTLTELYNQATWQRLAGLANSQDIVDITRYVNNLNNGLRITKKVIPPPNIGAPYTETFYECVVTDNADDEEIRLDTVLLPKVMTLMFTYSRKNWIKSPRDPSNTFVF